jgi:branched-chain amino acid transport system substrate-binding protein
LKKIVFLIIASILVIGLVLPGCAGGGGGGGQDTRPAITFAIADAMTDITGEHAWLGAELARDEINAGPGVNVGGVYHKVALVQVDTNEVSGTPEEGVNALEAVINDVDFDLGGWQAENVAAYREVAMDAQKIFMDCGAPYGSLQYSVVKDYDYYKYWFKAMMLNDSFIMTRLFRITSTMATVLKNALLAKGDAVAEDYGVPEDGKLRVAILTESTAWCSDVAVSGEVYLHGLGFIKVGIWLVSPTATDISIELSQIAAAKPHIIFTAFSGPVANVYSKQKAELGIPAMTIGINVEGQQENHWADTEGKCNGEIYLDTWAEGLQNTAKTTAFFNAFVAKTGEYPILYRGYLRCHLSTEGSYRDGVGCPRLGKNRGRGRSSQH